MPSVIRIALCQSNLVVGDLSGNVSALQARIREARERGANVALFPELSLTGYPPEDLLLKPSFVQDAAAALGEVAAGATGIVACVGVPEPVAASGAAGGGEAAPATVGLHNAAAVLADGRVAALYRKHHLPNYAVFDERRYFQPGAESLVIELDGRRVGVTICEDIWMPGGPAEWAAVNGGAEIVVNLSASPYHRGKGREREELFAARCRDHRCFLAFCNAVGGQDELVFDGHSLVIGPDGTILARGANRSTRTCSSRTSTRPSPARSGRSDPALEHVRYQGPDRSTGPCDSGSTRCGARFRRPASHDSALPQRPPLVPHGETGTRCLPRRRSTAPLRSAPPTTSGRTAFRGPCWDSPGGIDSALALTIAADAIGPDAVTAVSMPSRYTAGMNRDDAAILARRLGTRFLELPIEELAVSYGDALAEPFAGTEPNVAEENLQARIRGNLLMALSNKFGWLVLTTGNKSEMSVGYATLYGDMAGGFAVLKDVLKTWVYRLAVWRNRDGEVIPQRIIDKPPTAELRDNQRDSDSLPPYDVLDGILEAYVEQDRSPAEIGALGFARETVERVVQLVDRAEYKRRQAPPGVRISTRAFGKDRRLPITNRYAPAS